MTIDDSVFHNVPLNTHEPHACSPTDPGGNWRGILVRAPSRVAPREHETHAALTLPLCGLYRLGAASVMGQKPMTLVITDHDSKQVYRAEVIEQDSSPEEPPPPSAPLDPAELATMTIGSHFNLDVTTYVALPAGPAHYDIVVEYAGQRSNQVSIVVLGPPKPTASQAGSTSLPPPKRRGI